MKKLTLRNSPISIHDSLLLADILENIDFNRSGRVYHRAYPNVENPPAETFIRHLQQLPPSVCRRYLTVRLQAFLHDFYFSGVEPRLGQLYGKSPSEVVQNDVRPSTPSDATALKNDSYHGLDVAFYRDLENSNSGLGYWDGGWELCGVRSEDVILVTQYGLTLEVLREEQVAPEDRAAEWGHPSEFGGAKHISIRLPASQIEPDFYIAVGNAGLPQHQFSGHQGGGVQFFFNLQAAAASPLLKAATQHLNDLGLCFRLQVLNAPDLYGDGYAAGVLEILRSDYDRVRPWLEQLDLALNPGVLPLTKPLAPGLSVAEVPQQNQNREINARSSSGSRVSPWSTCRPLAFAEHRCRAIATALVEAEFDSTASHSGTSEPPSAASLRRRQASLRGAFAASGISWERPYLNCGSPDL